MGDLQLYLIDYNNSSGRDHVISSAMIRISGRDHVISSDMIRIFGRDHVISSACPETSGAKLGRSRGLARPALVVRARPAL